MGPLKGYKIIEIAGIGPGPFACMMLADMGADVIRLERPTGAKGVDSLPANVLNRGRPSVGVDLKHPDAVELILGLVERADALIEPFRPGVAERLGFGPDACLARNPRLVYGRMTGWGQEGPLAKAAGHDINYIALTGALHAIGREGQPPVPPLNLVGDFGGGGMLLAFGMVCGLLEAQRSGRGQVVDAAMVDGSALLFGAIFGLHAAGVWKDMRGVNLLDTGAPFYDVYRTSDGKYVAIGSLEPQFYALLLEKAGVAADGLPHQHDRAWWPELRKRLTSAFLTKTRDEWCRIMEGSDVCFAPVLSMVEAPAHPHNQARSTFIEVSGVTQPAPAPRFSRSKATVQRPPAKRGEHTDEALRDWGFAEADLAALRRAGAIA